MYMYASGLKASSFPAHQSAVMGHERIFAKKTLAKKKDRLAAVSPTLNQMVD
jgi:hypothetical protein